MDQKRLMLEFVQDVFKNNPKAFLDQQAIEQRLNRELIRPIITAILTSLEQSGVIKNLNGFYILAPDHGGSAEDISEFAKRLKAMNNCNRSSA